MQIKNKNIFKTTAAFVFALTLLLDAFLVMQPLQVFGQAANDTFCQNDSDCASGYCDLNQELCADRPGVTGTPVAPPQPGGTGPSGPTVRTPTQTQTPGQTQPTTQAQTQQQAPAGSAPCTQGACGTGFCSVNGVCVPQSPVNCSNGSIVCSGSVMELILTVLKILLTIVGVIAVVIIIIGGFQYMTSGGNEEQAEKGRKAIVNAVIGLIVVILSYAIVTIVTKTLTNGLG